MSETAMGSGVECGAASIPWQPEVGYICDLPAGHGGEHAARRIIASWSDRDDNGSSTDGAT